MSKSDAKLVGSGDASSRSGAENARFRNTLIAATMGAWIAEATTIPFDTLKVLGQVRENKPGASNGMVAVAREAVSQHGARSLWYGIEAGMLRHLLYASLRISLYEPLRDRVASDPAHVTIPERIMAGMAAGGLAMVVGSPADLLKVKSQAARINAMKAGLAPTVPKLVPLAKEVFAKEGVAGFYRGLGPNVARNMLVNASEVAVYDIVGTYLRNELHWESKLGVFTGSVLAVGVSSSLVASPVDVIKTRVMAAVRDPTGKPPSALAAVVTETTNLARTEGVKGFFRGITPNCLRMTSFNAVIFGAVEVIRGALE